MSRIPKDPKEIFDEFIKDFKGIYGYELISVILYGSASGKDYIPGRSDINFMIVLTDEGIKDLERSFDMVKKWKKRNVAVPLFVTQSYIETSMDVYPIEYLNFQQRHILVHGKDMLKGLTFKKEFIRLQAEREIKGKLLLLRETYLESRGKKPVLMGIINQSLHTFIAIFNALLFLKDIDIPEGRRSIIANTCEAYGLDNGLFIKLLDIMGGKMKSNEKGLNNIFKKYLEEIRRLSKIVDKIGG